MTKPLVAYLRVSTDRQGKSGLGLEAQAEAIKRFADANGFEIIHDYVEVETGKGADALDKRPVLANALALAKRRKCPIIVAKLDRLSRDVEFIAHLMNKKVDFIVAAFGLEVPTFLLHVYAAVAQEERRVIGERTKDALKAVVARGVTGKGKPITKLGSPNGTAATRARADQRAEELRKVIGELRERGHVSSRAIAKGLNERGLKTPFGKPWTSTQVIRLVKRLEAA